MPAKSQKAQTPDRLPHQQTWLRFAHSTFRDVWFYIAAAALVLNLVNTFKPALQVQATGATPGDPLGTLFTIVDTGAWTLHELHVSCVVYEGTIKIIDVQDNFFRRGLNSSISGPAPISVLAPSESVTRDCGVGPNNRVIRLDGLRMDAVRVDVKVAYRWFWGAFEGNTVRHFSTREIVSGAYILVPDSKP